MIRTFLTGILITGALAGCADSIHQTTPDAAPPDGAAPDDGATSPTPTGKVQTTRAADGTYTTIVDSTSTTAWTYADFETGKEAASSDAWDLRFQRFHVQSNGGVTGTGGVTIAPVTGTTFAAITAPESGYVADVADQNGDGVADSAFEQGDGWYSYDPSSHVLTPLPVVWVVKTAGGATLALEIASYYDAAGTGGWFKLRWRPL